MYVILTSKPGNYRTEAADGMAIVETYDYVFCGTKRAEFAIATLDAPAKVRVVEEGSGVVNAVPSKFLPHFDDLEGARAELRHLTRFGHMDIVLVKH